MIVPGSGWGSVTECPRRASCGSFMHSPEFWTVGGDAGGDGGRHGLVGRWGWVHAATIAVQLRPPSQPVSGPE